jgi:hypothetical protein
MSPDLPHRLRPKLKPPPSLRPGNDRGKSYAFRIRARIRAALHRHLLLVVPIFSISRRYYAALIFLELCGFRNSRRPFALYNLVSSLFPREG